MASPDNASSKRDTVKATVSGAQDGPLLPRLRSDVVQPPPPQQQQQPVPHTLEEFRRLEGREQRKARLREIWNQWPQRRHRKSSADRGTRAQKTLPATGTSNLTPEAAEKLSEMYDEELLGSCKTSHSVTDAHPIGWKPFVAYAKAKEAGTRFIVAILTVCYLLYSRTPRAVVDIPRRTRSRWER